jgi:hypothetical protein
MNVNGTSALLSALACAAAIGAVAGCDRVAATGAALAAANPLRGFEARCEALPPAHVDVAGALGPVTERYDVAYAELSARQRQESASHRTIGLTEVELHHASTIEFTGIEDGRGRACMRGVVRVEIAARPITVYVASEYRDDPCRKPEILAHEYRHVEVYRRYIEESAPALAAALRARIGDAPHYGTGRESVQEALDEAIKAELRRLMADGERELARRNAEVDSPGEYASLVRGCG